MWDSIRKIGEAAFGGKKPNFKKSKFKREQNRGGAGETIRRPRRRSA
jgi:hypothetical protein